MRSIFLYPFSMSFIVTGPGLAAGCSTRRSGSRRLLHDLGFDGFRFDWIVRPGRVIYTLVFAAVWHASGLVMAIMLAGLRGIDEDIWKAARIDGMPAWRVYVFDRHADAGRQLRHRLRAARDQRGRLYDLSVAMTNGGPGIASEVPAKFVMDHLFERGNLGARHRGGDRRC